MSQRGATKAQLQHRNKWLRVESLDEARVWSADLDRAHLNRYRKAVCNDIAADLLGALLEAGL